MRAHSASESTDRISMPSVPGWYSRPISFHSPGDCGILIRAINSPLLVSVSVERRGERQRGGGWARDIRFSGDEIGGGACRDVALEDAAVAEAHGAQQPRAGPGA